NLEIMVVDPDPSLEIALLAEDLFGSNIKHVGVQLVLLLLADIQDVVIPNLIRSEHKRQAILDVIQIFLSHPNTNQCRLWGEYDVSYAAPLVVKTYIEDLLVLAAVGSLAFDCLDFDILSVGVLVASFLEFLLFSGEALDDLFDRDS